MIIIVVGITQICLCNLKYVYDTFFEIGISNIIIKIVVCTSLKEYLLTLQLQKTITLINQADKIKVFMIENLIRDLTFFIVFVC